MKAGYTPCSLGSVAKVIAGQSPEGKYYNDKGEGLPFYQGKKEFGERVIGEPTTWTTDVTKIGEPGDILMSVRAPVGPVNFTDQKICIGRGLAAIRSSETIDSDFLYYQLLSKQDEIAGTEGAVFASINKAAIEALQVVVPAIEEQRRIVTLLDEAFADIATAKANAEKNLQNARELFESHLQATFTLQEGWTLKSFGDLADFRNGINFTKSSKGEAIKIIGVRDFQKNFWAPLDDLEAIIPEGEMPASDLIQSGDILFVRSNGNPELIGRSLLVGDLQEPITHSGFTIKARLRDTQLSPIYLCHYLKSGLLRREMIEGGNGANIKSLNQGTLSRLKIAFPDKAKQLIVVEQLEKVQAEIAELESIYRQKLTALDDLKKSLLHQAFSGQL